MNENLFYKIEGYLESLANLNSIVDGNCSYSFSFIKIEKIEDASSHFKELVIDQYKRMHRFNLEDKKDIEFIRYLNTHIKLTTVDEWEKSLLDTCNEWFIKAFKNNSLLKNNIKLDPSSVSYEFIDMLIAFFDDTLISVWELDEKIKTDLTYFWGGLGYKDFIFDTKDLICILHFEFDD